MELRQYGAILFRRIWIPFLLVVLVAGVSLATQKTPPPSYSTAISFLVGVKPERVPGQFNYDGYYASISSEFIADDLSVIVTRQIFVDDVNKYLAEMGSPIQISPGVFSGMTFAGKQHRVLQLNITWPDAAQLQDIARAAVRAIETDSETYLSPLGAFGALITVIDGPTAPVAAGPSLTQKLDLPVRLILALIAGVGLVFLLHYLDTSVRDAAELEALNVAVLGEIPKH